MPEQFRTWTVYLAKKSVGSAQSEEVYFTVSTRNPKALNKPL